MLSEKIISSEERLKQEKNKVKEVIQAQRDVRKNINASNSKRDSADFSSPGKPDPASTSNSRRNNNSIKGGPNQGNTQMSENMAVNYAEILNENERLRNEKLELENSNHILRKFKKIYN